MKFPPVFTFTPTIQKTLYGLDVLKVGYELRPIPAERITNLQRISLLKSSLFSAKIEGNPLELSDVEYVTHDSGDQHMIEVQNLMSAYKKLSNSTSQIVSIDILKNFHANILHGLSSGAGFLRLEESAIYNTAGIAVYLTPAPQQIRLLLEALCAYINTTHDVIPVVAGFAHIWFEKIHPFLDGNGRVGRLLSAHILQKGGYNFNGLVPFEQYLDQHRDDYYYYLGRDRQDVTEFIEFYLTALLSQSMISLKAAYQTDEPDNYDHLMPRRAEVLRIIQEHKIVSFDFLSRRFRAVPVRTLHNDLSQLSQAGLVQKMGSTRGALYTLKK